MSDQPRESSTFVSLQSGPREPGAGVHVVSGVLLGNDLAVFVLPGHVELRSDLRLHVMISPAAPVEDDVIERILPRRIDVMSGETDPAARVALVSLANPSRYAAAPAEREKLRSRVTAFLRGTSLPTALADAGLMAAEVRPGGVDRMLAEVVRIESRQGRHMIRHRLGQEATELADSWIPPDPARAALPAETRGALDGLALAPG